MRLFLQCLHRTLEIPTITILAQLSLALEPRDFNLDADDLTNLVREEVERCVSPYLKRHKCRDIEVVIDDETDPDLGARYCTVSFSPPTRGKTVHDLYLLAQGLREFLVVLVDLREEALERLRRFDAWAASFVHAVV